MRGTWRGGVLFTGDPEKYAKYGSGNGRFHRGPALGEHGGTLLS